MITAWCILSFAVACVMHGSLWWRLLGRRRRAPGGDLPPVTILKPLKGCDPDLEANLTTFFELEYPSYQLLFGVRDRADPALAVIDAVAARHPGVDCETVVSDREVGLNPKVNNLANMLPRARHELVLISDSNVAVRPAYLRQMVPELLRPGVGLVTSFIRAARAEGLGGALEALQLHTTVMGAVATTSVVPFLVCAVGKSMLLRRRDLERIGGLEALGGYLAEDQVCAQEIEALGLHTVVSPWPVDNVLGRLSVRQFASRHLRWARIRRFVAPITFAIELLSVPLLPAAIAVVVEPGRRSVWLAAAVVAATSGLALITERALGVRRNPLCYPVLEPLRGLLMVALWIVPYLSDRVRWRGRLYRIGRRTVIRSSVPEALADDHSGPAGCASRESLGQG